MKKLILGLLSALALLPGGMLRSGDVRAAETFAVQSPRRDHCANPHANCHGERYEDRRGRYTKDSWSVYYRGRKVEGASVSSFADLGGGYGKDNWTVFYEGRKLEGASAMSFEYKGRGYGKDNWNTYFRGEQLRPGQSPDGMLGGGYAKDSWSVYYRGERWKAFRLRRSNIWAAVTARTPGRWSIRDAKCRAHRRRRLKSLGGVTPGTRGRFTTAAK